jgi:putative restriction endonuclease
MSNNQTIKIDGKDYEVLDAKEKMTVPDCWVLRNKIGKGHGEAKFYVGQGKEVFDFFDDFSRDCIILKEDLKKYLGEVKGEYENPEQPYKNKLTIREELEEYNGELQKFEGDLKSEGEIITFHIEHQKQIKPPRIYINSDDKIYKFLRKISLPNITYLSALKLKSPSDKIIYYFKLFVDYFGEEAPEEIIEKEEEQILEDSVLKDDEKKSLVRARQGQGKYREGVLALCPFCPITLVSDDRLLIASHIKPWVKSDKDEKIDPKNGFMLTPTFDFLFDRGYITFENDKTMVISPWLSKMTLSKLGISPGKKYLQLPTEEREEYLEYHRQNIFKK